jgi:malate synthase
MAVQLLLNEKLDEANLGFDGSWVVHPALVQPASKCFASVIMNAVN